jgi:hypothetical protein
VSLDFDWPIHKTWEGFLNPYSNLSDECPDCEKGYSPRAHYLHQQWYGRARFDPKHTGSEPFYPNHPVIARLAARNTGNEGGQGEGMERARLANHFNARWCHHLSQDDVDALVAADRLWDFTRRQLNPSQETFENGWTKEPNGYHPTAKEVNEWSLSFLGHDSINCHVVIEARCEREGVSATCETCGGSAELWESEDDKKKYNEWTPVEPSAGEGYQLWENVSEGSPVSPVFATPEALADWLVKNDDSITRGTSRESWIEFISKKDAYAPSFVVMDGKVVGGVEAVTGGTEEG